MKFQIERSIILEISDSVLKVFKRHIQNKPLSREAGGILIGRISSRENNILIDVATSPHSNDIRKRFFFFRRKEKAQQIVNKYWQKSGGTKIYLGEWHTHPESNPNPSLHDLKNWINIFSKATYEQDFLVFTIVGTENICCWMIRDSSLFKLKMFV